MDPVIIGPGPGEDGQKCPHPDSLSGEDLWVRSLWLAGSTLVVHKALTS